MFSIITDHLHYYRKFLFRAWDHMGPQEYVIILIGVGAIGWYMMRKAARL
ncbi:MAG: hypothetical protein WCJ09_08090 [Planctomycetota bacterium]